MNKNEKKVVSIEDRIPKLKEARKKKANRRLVFYMLIFFALISIIVYLQSPLSFVRSVEINGNRYLTEEEVIEISGLLEDTNIWSLDLKKVARNLESSTVVKESTAERKLPSTVVITLEEIQIVALMEKNDMYYPLLNNGELLMSYGYETFNGEAPLMIGFTEDENLPMIASELSKVPQDILDLISEIHWLEDNSESTREVIFYMTDGFVVKGSIRDFAEGMLAYPSIVSQLDPNVKGIIHMGVGVYFEAFNVDEEEIEELDEAELEE